MAWRKKANPEQPKRGQIALAIALFVVILIVGFAIRILLYNDDNKVEVTTTPIASTDDSSIVEDERIKEEPGFDAVALQKAVELWLEDATGNAGVYITEVDGAVLAATEPDQVFFAASIYKLYVAYEGYQRIDEGIFDPSEVYVSGFTRAECLDKMIRESDSPCAEKLWIELGKEAVTKQLISYGLKNTSMTALTTTAADAGIILSRIATGERLSQESQQALLQSMENQVYRDTLNKSFDQSVTVYNKIGFRELDEYHDVAIVQFEDGRQLIISVLTNGVGTGSIVRLGQLINDAVLAQ
jgi:beta-lactamase class A